MQTSPKLGIIAGGGRLPLELAESCRSSGRPCFIIALEGAADIGVLHAFPHASVRLGAVGELLELLRREGVEEVVLAGGVKRPSIRALMPDAMGAKVIATLGLKLFGGDDALLKTIIRFFEQEGFRVIGADQVLSGLLAPKGLIAGPPPDNQASADIALGFRVAKALGALDIGQAVVVETNCVLAVEAAEGTDALIIRAAPLMREKQRAVLIKARKPGQEARADLPAIGPSTLTGLYESGFLGLAVEAGGALLLDREELLRKAEAYGIFIVGFPSA